MAEPSLIVQLVTSQQISELYEAFKQCVFKVP